MPGEGFEQDGAAGHGTHTAGSAAGATLNTPAQAITCEATQVMGCVGGCIDSSSTTLTDDDLVSFSQDYATDDIDRLCPLFNCDGDRCLGDDVSETLTDYGGVARGAKLAIFDVSNGGIFYSDAVGNNIWEACMDAGCKVHSNSWGGDGQCSVDAMDISYDDFMYKVSSDLRDLPLNITARREY